MQIQLVDPDENDSIHRHPRKMGMGSLICRATRQTGQKNTTNEVTPAVCFSCHMGRILREVGCHA